MTYPTTGFGTWVLYGPKIEEERQRISRLLFPSAAAAKDPRTGRPVPPPEPDYGPDDQHWYGWRILNRAAFCGRRGFDMDRLAVSLVNVDDPHELATVNAVLTRLDEVYSSQDLEHT